MYKIGKCCEIFMAEGIEGGAHKNKVSVGKSFTREVASGRRQCCNIINANGNSIKVEPDFGK
jgi:hypothetical protein